MSGTKAKATNIFLSSAIIHVQTLFCFMWVRVILLAWGEGHMVNSPCPSPPLDNIRVMVIVWRLRGKIIRTGLCWVVWHSVHSQQHTYMSSSNRSSRLGLSHWDTYAMRRGGCLELYYCNMVEWSWCDSSLIWRPSGFLQCFDTVGLVIWPVKIVPEMTYNVSSGTLSLYTTTTPPCPC